MTTAKPTINQKVGKLYNAADARHVNFPNLGEGPERGDPMVVDITSHISDVR